MKKVKITSTIVHEKKTTTSVFTEWRATDLHDLVLRRSASDGSYESHLEHVVLGMPATNLLSFPNPPCKYDPTLDTTHNAAQAPGAFRAVSFFDASLAVPGADSPAILINYRPPGKGASADAAAWQRFLDSITAELDN